MSTCRKSAVSRVTHIFRTQHGLEDLRAGAPSNSDSGNKTPNVSTAVLELSPHSNRDFRVETIRSTSTESETSTRVRSISPSSRKSVKFDSNCSTSFASSPHAHSIIALINAAQESIWSDEELMSHNTLRKDCLSLFSRAVLQDP